MRLLRSKSDAKASSVVTRSLYFSLGVEKLHPCIGGTQCYACVWYDASDPFYRRPTAVAVSSLPVGFRCTNQANNLHVRRGYTNCSRLNIGSPRQDQQLNLSAIVRGFATHGFFLSWVLLWPGLDGVYQTYSQYWYHSSHSNLARLK